MPKYKSKLREKMKLRNERGEAGRSLGTADRTVQSHYGQRSKPRAAKSKSPISNLGSRIRSAITSSAKKAATSKLKSSSESNRGLTGIRHPAQLIPAIKTGRTVAGLVKAIVKKF